MALSDSCFDFFEEFAAAARKLSENAHWYSAAPFDYGAEIDALRRLARTVAEHPYDTAAGGRLLLLTAKMQLLHDAVPDGEEFEVVQREVGQLVKVLQEGALTEEERAAVPDIVRNVVVDTPFTERAALRLKELLPKLGKSSYELAVRVIGDVASAAAKRWMGM
jgi:MoxR-like ATPase